MLFKDTKNDQISRLFTFEATKMWAGRKTHPRPSVRPCCLKLFAEAAGGGRGGGGGDDDGVEAVAADDDVSTADRPRPPVPPREKEAILLSVV